MEYNEVINANHYQNRRGCMTKKHFIVILLLVVYTGFILYKHHESITIQEASQSAANLKENLQENEESLRIVTSFYPVYMHTQEITKGVDVQVVNMASEQVGCLHDYQLTVEDTKKLYNADILIINGMGAENFIEKAYVNNKHLQVIDASQSFAAKLEEEMEQLEVHGEAEEGHSEELHEHTETVGHEGHDHGQFNEHVWMSIEGSMMQVQMISQELQRLDPEHAEAYVNNEARYIKQLQTLKQEANEKLSHVQGQSIVTVHNALDYFAEEFGLDIVATIPEGTYENAAAKEMQELVEEILEHDVQGIYTEKAYAEVGIVQTIQRETGIEIKVIDTLVKPTLTQEEDVPEYISRMQKNINVLSEVKK